VSESQSGLAHADDGVLEVYSWLSDGEVLLRNAATVQMKNPPRAAFVENEEHIIS
jgi:hypothetical protein